MLLPKSRGPRVSMHHTQENARQLPDSPGPRRPPLNPSPLAGYKEHIASLEPLSKSRRSHCETPPPHAHLPTPTSSSVSGGKCKRAEVEMLQSAGEVNG